MHTLNISLQILSDYEKIIIKYKQTLYEILFFVTSHQRYENKICQKSTKIVYLEAGFIISYIKLFISYQ